MPVPRRGVPVRRPARRWIGRAARGGSRRGDLTSCGGAQIPSQGRTSMKHVTVVAEGHLIDTGLMSRYFGAIVDGGGSYEMLRFDVGKTKSDYSTMEIEVRAPGDVKLRCIIDNLVALGCRLREGRDVVLEKAPKNGVAPAGFYATTHHRTRVRVGGRFVAVADRRMDAVIVVSGRSARCRLIRDLKRGDAVVCGVDGVEIQPPFETRKADSFSFMRSESSSERAVEQKAREVARIVREVKRAGKKVVFVPGPVVVHTGARASFCALIRKGWVDGVLSGNALAVHDAEASMFGTSLGIDVREGRAVSEGHMHHLRAINTIRSAGSIAAAVRDGSLKSGIFKELVDAGVPFVLAGSIRDDGPLPDTEMDLIRAQERYAALLKDAGLVVILATMLHGIGVGNMSPSDVTLVCVDIHPGVVTKLADRGSAHAVGIVTDVSAFLHRLNVELRSRAPGAQPRPVAPRPAAPRKSPQNRKSR